MKHVIPVAEFVNSLTADQMTRIYDVIDGPIPPELAQMSDTDLANALRDMV